MRTEKTIRLKPSDCSVYISDWSDNAYFAFTEKGEELSNVITLDVTLLQLRELQKAINSDLAKYDAKQLEKENPMEPMHEESIS